MASHDRRFLRPPESRSGAARARFVGALQPRPTGMDRAPWGSRAAPLQAFPAVAGEPRTRAPRVERLVARSGSRSAVAVAGALAAIIAVGVAGRLSGHGVDARATATSPATGVATGGVGGARTSNAPGTLVLNGDPVPAAGSAILTAPRPDVLWSGTALMPVSGVAGSGLEAVRLVVSAGEIPIGSATLPVVAGRFGGTIVIVPPVVRSSGMLEVFDAAGGSRAVAQVRFPIESGRLLLLTSPEAAVPSVASPLAIAGIAYEAVPEIRIVLTGGSGVLAERIVTPSPARDAVARAAGAVGSFSTRLRLSGPGAAGPARLHVMALRSPGGMEVGHVDLALVVAAPVGAG